MRTGRFMSSRKAAGAAVVASVLAMGIGGGVAAANEPSSKSESARLAAVTDARTCGIPTTHSFSGIFVSVRGCLQRMPTDDNNPPVKVEYSGDVEVRTTTPNAPLPYCRVELEGPNHEVRTVGCTAFVNQGVRPYLGGVDGRAVSDAWTRVTVLVGINKNPLRIVMATYETVV